MESVNGQDARIHSHCLLPAAMPEARRAFKAGEFPYRPWGVQQLRITPAAKRADLGTGIGWHTFRHTYSTMLRHLRVDVKVQQELLRHADIHTTLNVYTQGVAGDLREAPRRVVRMVIPAPIM